MAYATAADLARYSLPTAALVGTSTADQDAALAAASAIVDSYIGGRFQLPLTAPYPLDLVITTTQLAAYFVMVKRGFNPQVGDAEQFERLHAKAVGYLKDVASGKALPGGDSGVAVDAETGVPTRDAPFVVAQAPGGAGQVVVSGITTATARRRAACPDAGVGDGRRVDEGRLPQAPRPGGWPRQAQATRNLNGSAPGKCLRCLSAMCSAALRLRATRTAERGSPSGRAWGKFCATRTG